MKYRVLLVAESDGVGTEDFDSRAQAQAFADGFQRGAGEYSGSAYGLLVNDFDGLTPAEQALVRAHVGDDAGDLAAALAAG